MVGIREILEFEIRVLEEIRNRQGAVAKLGKVEQLIRRRKELSIIFACRRNDDECLDAGGFHRFRECLEECHLVRRAAVFPQVGRSAFLGEDLAEFGISAKTERNFGAFFFRYPGVSAGVSNPRNE